MTEEREVRLSVTRVLARARVGGNGTGGRHAGSRNVEAPLSGAG
jgi:hypothetical protein